MVLFPFILPLLVLPLLIGGYLLSRSSASPVTTFMALLTLKPVLATPLWLGLVQLSATPSWTDPIPDALLYALPGIGLTLLIMLSCRASLKGQSAGLIVILLLLDTLRWGSTVLTQGMDRPPGAEFLFMLSLMMPSVFAIVAWLLHRRLT
jgi:hypothetical protein